MAGAARRQADRFDWPPTLQPIVCSRSSSPQHLPLLHLVVSSHHVYVDFTFALRPAMPEAHAMTHDLIYAQGVWRPR